MPSRRSVLAAPFLLLPSRAAASRTNVVIFMSDDHGAWANGCYGCADIQTPNIDRLAATGTRFTGAYACTPVCSPSRMTYMTGLIPSQHGVQDYLQPSDSFGPTATRFLDGHPTWSEALAAQGYTLGMCGKWHMGDDDKAQRGFSYWHTVPGGGGTYRDPEFVTNGTRRKLTGYKTNLVTDGALEFLDTVRNKPFVLHLPFYAPHTPYDYQPEEFREPYRSSNFSCFPDAPKHPWQNPELAQHHGQRASKLGYSALITGMDHNIGRVLQRLDQMGVRENTLVIFTADQGWSAGHHGVWGKGNGTWPFNMYEEALRVPLIWTHPGRISADRVIPSLVSSYDFFPTILDYLEVPAPKGGRRPGRSYTRLLRGEAQNWRNRLYFEYANVRGLRTQTLKYIERTAEFPSELYDLEADPGETKSVLRDAAYARTAATLRTELAGFFRSSGAPPIQDWRTTVRHQLHTYPPPRQ
ncbi:sulfatase family protein [Paludibaculum fermentans]|uniref:Sulfatase-like hydrolase/transferase n=1 Tax=Paludibaculum fermentans TaxID=1473598 RepID=A0A7S7NWJ5_PALFE|nr:sulfatase-like hydrolase/transferase [Paludibaculum fermentans]QOY91112.1 sulfatase-like hydrolase/transferase [Paludibaculum fermentans]